MKWLLIDAAAREIREVEWTESMASPISLQKHIGGSLEAACMWPSGDVLYVDEDGLAKPQRYFFRIDTRPDQPMPGNGIVVGRERYDSMGDYLGTDNPQITVEALRGIVRFLSRAQVDAWAKGNASDPATAFSYLDADGVWVTEVTGHMGEIFASMPRPIDE
jgi:hypothetical protein